MLRIFCLVALVLCTIACGELSFAPPPQQTTVPQGVRAVFEGVADRADPPWVIFNKDVMTAVPGVGWRWLRAHPAMQFHLLDVAGWHLIARLTTVGKVIQTTGAQHVVFSVNGSEVASATMDKSATYDFSFPMEPGVLQLASPVTVRLDIDPCLPAESPAEKGLPYCALLQRIGFTRDAE